GISCGGVWNTARSGFSDVLTIQANGKSIARPPISRSTYRSTRGTKRRRDGVLSVQRPPVAAGRSTGPVVVASGIDDPALLQAELEDSDDQDHDEQHPAHRRCVAHAPEAERVLHDLLHDDGRRAGRAS